MEITILIFLLGGLFLGWSLGANDAANVFGTAVGTRMVSFGSAAIVCSVFVILGAIISGGGTTETLGKLGAINALPGAFAACVAAGISVYLMTKVGLPVSTTQAIVGAIVGFAAVGIGIEAVKWGKVGSIAASWVVSPVIAGTLAYALFRSVQKLILDTSNRMKNAVRYVPSYIFLTGAMISLVTMFKGLKHIGLELSEVEAYSISFLIGLICALIGAFFIRKCGIKGTK